jgi:hypothetical protein
VDDIDYGPEQKDLTKYQMAVQLASGGFQHPSLENGLDDVSMAFVQRGSVDHAVDNDALSVSFNYEKWLGTSNIQKHVL